VTVVVGHTAHALLEHTVVCTVSVHYGNGTATDTYGTATVVGTATGVVVHLVPSATLSARASQSPEPRGVLAACGVMS
jgi:threonine/homoserine/homoserine lactone efflux protein